MSYQQVPGVKARVVRDGSYILINLSFIYIMKALSLFFISMLSGLVIYSQNQNPLNLSNITPSTPEVSALGKYVDIPVGYSTGAPQISVPFHTLQAAAVSVPVGISYNASGIRVEEAATSVGLGWMLNTGASLSRVVHGLPDDDGNGYMYTTNKVRYILSLSTTSSEYINIHTNLIPNGLLDVEPDMYIFSVPGYSGKFYYDQDSSRFILSPYQHIKIEYSVSGLNTGFILTLPDGVKCYFGISEDGSRTSYEYMNDQQITYHATSGSSQASNYNATAHTSAWSVLDIVSPLNKAVRFYYTVMQAKNFGRAGEVTNYRGTSGCDAATNSINASFFEQLYYKPVIQSIADERGSVEFIYASQVRQDVAMNEKALDSVIVKNSEQQRITTYSLQYEYTTSSDSTELVGLLAFTHIARKRLMLKAVKQANGGASMPAYEFSYNPLPLPDRLSSSQDYWGYYNGKTNGYYLTPLIRSKFVVGTGDGFYNSGTGADRRVDTNYTQAAMLTKVKYPTGGTTSYFYEPNTASQIFYDPNSGIERSGLINRSYYFPFLFEGSPDTLFYKQYFTVGNITGKIKIDADLGGCPYGYVDGSCRFTIKIKGITDTTFLEVIEMSIVYYLTLPEGEYSIEAIIDPSEDPPPTFSVSLHWEEQSDPYNFIVGGLRVRKIISADSVSGQIARAFSYHKFDSPHQSSGFMAGIPVHVYKDQCGSCLEGGVVLWKPNSTKLVSNSAMPLQNNGQIIRYLEVTEYYDTAKAAFKTEYTFSTDLVGYMDGFSVSSPPHVKMDWQNSNLLGKRVYEKTAAGVYRVLLRDTFFFAELQDTSYYFGLKYVPLTVAGCSVGDIKPYLFRSQWYLPDSSSSTQYAYTNSQESIATGTKNYYNDRFLLAKTSTINSDGQVRESKIWYPQDYNNISGYNINTLISRHMIGLPVKQENTVSGKIISGNTIKYNADGQPVEVYSYENTLLADTAAHDKNTILSAHYNLKSSASYGVNGSLTQVVSSGDDRTVILWDAKGVYPVAQVKNADTSSVAYTSFEISATAKWTLAGSISSDNTAMTGNKVYSLSAGDITKGGLSAQTYIVSYWKKAAAGGTVSVNGVTPVAGKTANGWTYYQHIITNPSGGLITVSGTGTIDELRLYPEKAQMTSFTVVPLVGITSQSDANNRILRYQYDGLNRLSLIRDEDNNIIKKICYGYQGQAVDCGYGTLPAWQAIGSTCEQDGGNNTGNQLVTERDMNPASATYNQTRVITIANTGLCPVCDISACTGNDKKCINNICETGVRVNTGSERVNQTQWKCFYHYRWSDNSTSQTYEQIQTGPFCPLN